MKHTRITFSVPSLLVIIALMGVVAYQAAARRPAMLTPTVVVTVDRSRVLENLKERAEAQASLEQLMSSKQAEVEKRRLDAQSLQTQLEKAVEAGVALDELERMQMEFDRARLELENYRTMAANQVDLEISLMYVKLYKSIADAIAVMAEAERYDIVLVHDGNDDFIAPDPNLRISRENQIKQQIANRRVMYARAAYDITDALIVRMNTAFGAAPPAPSGTRTP